MAAASPGIDPALVSLAHNAMADEYDQLDDLWYPFLFAQIHELIAANLEPGVAGPLQALDVGCGTGFQAFLLARAGYHVLGFDVAADLVEHARAKIDRHAGLPLEAPPLFASRTWTDAERHHRRLAKALERLRGARAPVAPRFVVADASGFAYPTATYDVVTCCGSVLSFIDDWGAVLASLAQSLRPGGLLFVEAEQRVNLDLIWPALDRLLGGRLGYDQEWSEILGNLAAPPGRSLRLDYPFELRDGRELVLPLWAFSIRELQHQFRRAGLRIVDRRGIHWATNLVPSTVLHRPRHSSRLTRTVRALAALDRCGAGAWPFWRLGCSVFFCLRREASGSR